MLRDLARGLIEAGRVADARAALAEAYPVMRGVRPSLRGRRARSSSTRRSPTPRTIPTSRPALLGVAARIRGSIGALHRLDQTDLVERTTDAVRDAARRGGVRGRVRPRPAAPARARNRPSAAAETASRPFSAPLASLCGPSHHASSPRTRRRTVKTESSSLLRRNRNLRALVASRAASSAGTWLAYVALTVDVYRRTHSSVWVSAVLLADFLPTVAVATMFGPWLDRLPRRTLLIGSELAAGAVFAALPFAPSAAAVVGLALVAGCASAVFYPTLRATLPGLVSARGAAARQLALPDRRHLRHGRRAGARRPAGRGDRRRRPLRAQRRLVPRSRRCCSPSCRRPGGPTAPRGRVGTGSRPRPASARSCAPARCRRSSAPGCSPRSPAPSSTSARSSSPARRSTRARSATGCSPRRAEPASSRAACSPAASARTPGCAPAGSA